MKTNIWIDCITSFVCVFLMCGLWSVVNVYATNEIQKSTKKVSFWIANKRAIKMFIVNI